VRLSADPAARRRLALLIAAALAALVVGVAVGASSGEDETGRRAEPAPQEEPATRTVEAVDRLSLRQQVGQVTISSFPDPAAPAYVRRRLRARETAGVILFGLNAASPEQWRALTRSVQGPAGGDALVMVDQEGGEVRAVGWAGPAAAQPAQGNSSAVRQSAEDAARQLRGVGVNVNLAPVADVPGGAAPALGSRAFSGDADAIAAATRGAIEGMSSAGVAATAKHFPGLGRAQVNTDDGSAAVPGSVDGADLLPFRAAIAAEVPLVMLSHALYPALDGDRIASQSPAIVTGLLRRRLGFEGVIVTDSIEAQAVLDRSGVARAAERSIRAGADLILTTGSASWNQIHPWLLRRARTSAALRERIRSAAARVLALKRKLAADRPGITG
jgi:beta-N-acetylhexosaminidase